MVFHLNIVRLPSLQAGGFFVRLQHQGNIPGINWYKTGNILVPTFQSRCDNYAKELVFIAERPLPSSKGVKMPFSRSELPLFSLDRVLSRFSAHSDAIKEMYYLSPTFREICADYAKIVYRLESRHLSDEKSSDSHGRTANLLAELEAEIMKCIEANDAPEQP